MKTLLSSSITLALLLSASAQAQDNASADRDKPTATTLDNVIVTGTRAPKAVDRIPGAVSIITLQELNNSLSLTEDATAVLTRTIPGYSESTQALTNSGETLRGRIALRLFDGIPQTSPLRETNRAGSFTDLGVIGRIEVVNGPSAAEGVGAAGGIINYISKTPEEGSHTTVSTRYSTQGRDDSDGWKVGLTFGHKEDAYDLLLSTSFVDRGMAYDAKGRKIGMRGSGTINDSESKNLFLKLGSNFGEDGMQRLQASVSRFNLTGKGNYTGINGDRAKNITSTSIAGTPLGAKTEFNDFNQFVLSYSHADFFGGTLLADTYRADQAMRYPAEKGSDKQDPLIAPLGQLVDQSEVNSQKRGVRTSWTRGDLFGVEGLELRAGVDVVKDLTDQRLALTHRVWVPPMEYKSTAPYAQLSWDIGPLTVSGGLRQEDGTLSVDSYTTTYYNKRVFVEGGKLDYKTELPNFGVVYRFNEQLSAYASYSEGFSLPNVGIPLRNINKPGQSVSGILDLQAIIVENKEVGLNWRAGNASFSGSYYRSYSDFGVSLSTDPVTGDFVMNRGPVRINGIEFSGSYDFNDDLKINAMYSHIVGKTWFVKNGPLDKRMGANDVSPDKIGVNLYWRVAEQVDLNLGAMTLLSRTLNQGKSGAEHTSGRTLLDLSVNYDTGRFGRLTLGVENLFNKQYILTTSEASSSNDDWMAGRGRVFALSHNISF
ncbi:TonB-dependent receptor [Stenotrophomonas sp. YIM B06876]|uniref:TonB-dependent receptor n=1 Tax=Stenotrophomonas sp. YIM B06876 TaxID=3060211 RepID=UPI00273A4356|nr:TonB-dependent receptor [Stenotrophomonas sp. YIM B06876]